MALVERLRAYQLSQALLDSESELTMDSTVTAVLTWLRTGLTYPCPQCAKVGTIDTDGDTTNETVCPTCDGQGYTSTQKQIDYSRSSLIYKDVE